MIPDRLKEAKGAYGGHVGGVGGLIKADSHMALRGEVVDLMRIDLADQAGQAVAVGHVSVVQREGAIERVDILVEVVDPFGAEGAGPPDEPVNLIALGKKQFRQVGPILPGDAGNERAFWGAGHGERAEVVGDSEAFESRYMAVYQRGGWNGRSCPASMGAAAVARCLAYTGLLGR